MYSVHIKSSDYTPICYYLLEESNNNRALRGYTHVIDL